jgi:hypothetical protein
MSRGIGRTTFIGTGGIVTRSGYDAGAYDFLYKASTTKDSVYNVGDRVETPDGRGFRYSYAGGTCATEWGAGNEKKSNAVAVAPAQATAAAANDGTGLAAGVVGSRCVSVTVASPFGYTGDGTLAVDELKGGYIVIGNGSGQHPQMRMITGNPALATAGICRIYLDAPLTTAVTVGTTTIEMIANPYYGLIGDGGGGEYVMWMGVPAVGATVGQYFWVQTKGPCWVTSDGATCNSALDRTLVWAGNGSVVSSDDITLESGFQIAGVAIDASSSGASNAPFINLQMDI